MAIIMIAINYAKHETLSSPICSVYFCAKGVTITDIQSKCCKNYFKLRSLEIMLAKNSTNPYIKS